MVKKIEDMIPKITGKGKVRVAVAAAQDASVLGSLARAQSAGIIQAILVGHEEEIVEILESMQLIPRDFEIINVEGDLNAQAEKAVELVSKGEAQVLMKGLIDTSILFKTVLKKEYGLRTDRIMSVVALIESSFYHKLLMVTDPGVNIRPGLEEKKQIIENAVEFAKKIGIENPKVAILTAKEKVYEKMPETVDASLLKEMNEDGIISGCIIDGPLAFDNIVSKEAALIKGIDSPVAGDADIIVVPEIVCGNTLYKSLVYLSDIKAAGVVLGAKVPIVLTSRSDDENTKFNSIVVAALVGSTNRTMKIPSSIQLLWLH